MERNGNWRSDISEVGALATELFLELAEGIQLEAVGQIVFRFSFLGPMHTASVTKFTVFVIKIPHSSVN